MEGHGGHDVSLAVKERKKGFYTHIYQLFYTDRQRQACKSAEDKLMPESNLKDRCLDSMPR